MILANTDRVGFCLHTRTSLTIPGPWGTLALVWGPAAYAEAMRANPVPSGCKRNERSF